MCAHEYSSISRQRAEAPAASRSFQIQQKLATASRSSRQRAEAHEYSRSSRPQYSRGSQQRAETQPHRSSLELFYGDASRRRLQEWLGEIPMETQKKGGSHQATRTPQMRRMEWRARSRNRHSHTTGYRTRTWRHDYVVLVPIACSVSG